MPRVALVAALSLALNPANAQTAFDPHTVAYVICVTGETKKLALVTPEIEKSEIISRAFDACGDAERDARKALREQGASDAALDQRFAQIRKFIEQTAQDDIDRQRINRVPR